MKFLNKSLYIVSTPIGNLDDITIRAIEVLKKSDIILCEDTRHSLKLLNHLNIKKNLLPYHKFNEKKQSDKIIKYLNDGKILSLISDAGTPVLSDPGNLLIKECIKENIKIYSVPGPSSITSAMSTSGFGDRFLFYGFLPKKEKELEKVIIKLNKEPNAIIFFLPAIKINFYLKSFKKNFMNRKIVIAREISKIHETYYRDTIAGINLFKLPPKGEMTVVISGKTTGNIIVDNFNIRKEALTYLKKYSLKDVVELISKKEKIPKKKVYEICLTIKNEKII